MRPPRVLPFVLFVLFVDLLPAARAEEPFFKKGDVVAIVGGEDMVALSEYGYLELLLTRALPDHHLRFRNLAWEGDTVFEQRRDLGFPPWEEQLEKIGATVVLCQFGQMESLAGKEKLPEFIAAYEKLLARFSGGGKRRVVIIEPMVCGAPAIWDYAMSVGHLAQKNGWPRIVTVTQSDMRGNSPVWTLRDGVHLDEVSHRSLADRIGTRVSPAAREIFVQDEKDRAEVREWIKGRGINRTLNHTLDSDHSDNRDWEPLRQLIINKNRLWFDYWRVQNWAFLAGDRTNQPSSRDHLDLAKRWFPAERERFLPLIEAREKEIDALAEKLAKP